MFGAFRPSPSLSSGLLWKVPWRLSSTRKLRQRRRLRKVDNVVAILDNALKRDAATYKALHEFKQPEQSSTQDQASRRHDKGPHEGEFVPELFEASTLVNNSPILKRASSTLLADQARSIGTFKKLERWKAEMPTEAEMLPKNKYTIFDRNDRKYRKGIHKLPKWTRVSQRLNPPGF